MEANIGSHLNAGKNNCTDGIFRLAYFARDIQSCKFLPNRQTNLSALKKNAEKGIPESKKTVGQIRGCVMEYHSAQSHSGSGNPGISGGGGIK